MSPPSPPFGPSSAPSSPPSSFENDSGSFPSQAAPHSSDDHDQVPAGGGGSSSKGKGNGKGKSKNKNKGQGGGIGNGEGEGGPGFSMPFGTDAFGKPTIHLHSHIEGLFKEQDHDIGGSYSDAVLEHWRQLDSGKKLAVVTVDRDGIFDALRELHLTAQVAVEGEPGEEAAQAVVKDFLYALEVQDGKFRFPEAPSLEYIGRWWCRWMDGKKGGGYWGGGLSIDRFNYP